MFVPYPLPRMGMCASRKNSDLLWVRALNSVQSVWRKLKDVQERNEFFLDVFSFFHFFTFSLLTINSSFLIPNS